MKANELTGGEVVHALRQHADQPEMDKVKLFIDEVDKITSLVIGLSTRLIRLNNSSSNNNNNNGNSGNNSSNKDADSQVHFTIFFVYTYIYVH